MCSKGTFECQKILECIDEDRKCDGEPDCRDMTDEKYCKSYTTVCLSVYPSVPSSVCLSLYLSLFLIKDTSEKSLSSKARAKYSFKAIQKRCIGWQSFYQNKNVVVFDKQFDLRMADEIQTEMIYCYCFRAQRTHLSLENTVWTRGKGNQFNSKPE